jgi:hypothetical protein
MSQSTERSIYAVINMLLLTPLVGVAATGTVSVTETRPWLQEDHLREELETEVQKLQKGMWTKSTPLSPERIETLEREIRHGWETHWDWDKERAWVKRNADRMAIGTNETLLARIREGFKALPRPLIAKTGTRRLHTSMGRIFFGLFGVRTETMELTETANQFRNRWIEAYGSPFALIVALYPLMDDPYYSGDVIVTLHPHTGRGAYIAGKDIRYRSPTDRGRYDERGEVHRQSARLLLREGWWLDADGKPVIVPRGASRQVGIRHEDCVDRTNRPPTAVVSPANAPSVSR